jgi:hypothetical protein
MKKEGFFSKRHKSGFWREIVISFSPLSISAKPYGYTQIIYVKG